MTPRLRLALALVALAFLAAHARALPRTLEDIDSINLALGVEHFDVASHRPHPPGYPVYIALAKASTRAIAIVAPSWDRDRRAASGLAIWGLIAGTIAIAVFTAFWMAAGLSPLLAFLAALVAVASPPFWFSAARPLTDVPGLVAAVAVQAWFITQIRALRDAVNLNASGAPPPLARAAALEDSLSSRGPRAPAPSLSIAALAAGFIIGLRSQTLWLTTPLMLWAAVELLRRRRARDAGLTLAAFAGGVLLWAVPLVWVSGGPARYVNAVLAMGKEDFSGVEMLAGMPSSRLFSLAVRRTFFDIWVLPALAKTMLGLALLGLVAAALRLRFLLLVVLAAFAPYLVFHLIFHETVTLRYGLPLVLPVAGLAVLILSMTHQMAAVIGAAAIVIVGLVIVEPRLTRYARDGAPVFRAFEDMQRELPAMKEPPLLRMHHQVWWGVRRAMDWYRPYWDVGPQPFPGDREWLDPVRYWNGGGTKPIWFLSEITRNDMLLFDPRARVLKGRYEQSSDVRALIPAGFRLDSLSWWWIERPAWMLGSGWSLTPEIAGVTAHDSAQPNLRAAEAFLLRRPGPVRLLIGGRYLSPAGQPHARLILDMDGRPVVQWIVTSNPGWFVQWIDVSSLPAGENPYVRLGIRVESATRGGRAPVIGLEQFDSAGLGDLMFAIGEGWHELEENPSTGRLWRWTSERSDLVLKGAQRDVRLSVSGESPLKYFDHAPHVTVRAGERVLAQFSPSADFDQQIDIPADALAASSGHVAIETDLIFVPGERNNSPDRRHLGLRLFRIAVQEP